jgi:PTS system cellobiose-specific IIB component
MAKNIRQAAKARGKDVSVKARSDSEIEDYIEEIDLLLVGPHLKYMMDTIEATASEYDVPAVLIKDDAYGSLNGEAVLQQIEEIIAL